MVVTRAHGQGFTLIELLVAIALVAILGVIAVPAFDGFIANQRVKTAAFDLLAAFNYARSEAVKRNASVDIEAVDGSWSSGWLVTSGGSTLKEWGSPGSVAISSDNTSLTFMANGRISGGASASLSVCEGTKATKRIVTVDMSGRASIARAGVCGG